MVFIDVENTVGAIKNHLEGKCKQSSKSNNGNNDWICIRDKISFDALVKVIECRDREYQLRVIDAYAVAKDRLSRPLIKAKLKLPPKGPSKSIDDNLLIRLFTEELTLLRYFKGFNLCGWRTFVLVSGDADYYDIVTCALKAGFDVEIWNTSKGLSKSYTKLKNKFPCRNQCHGQLRVVNLEPEISRIYGFCRPVREVSGLQTPTQSRSQLPRRR